MMLRYRLCDLCICLLDQGIECHYSKLCPCANQKPLKVSP